MWTLELELLAALVDSVHWLQWSRSKDAQRRGSKPPRAIPRPSNNYNRKARGRLEGALSLTVDEVKRRLALPREPI